MGEQAGSQRREMPRPGGRLQGARHCLVGAWCRWVVSRMYAWYPDQPPPATSAGITRHPGSALRAAICVIESVCLQIPRQAGSTHGFVFEQLQARAPPASSSAAWHWALHSGALHAEGLDAGAAPAQEVLITGAAPLPSQPYSTLFVLSSLVFLARQWGWNGASSVFCVQGMTMEVCCCGT